MTGSSYVTEITCMSKDLRFVWRNKGYILLMVDVVPANDPKVPKHESYDVMCALVLSSAMHHIPIDVKSEEYNWHNDLKVNRVTSIKSEGFG